MFRFTCKHLFSTTEIKLCRYRTGHSFAFVLFQFCFTRKRPETLVLKTDRHKPFNDTHLHNRRLWISDKIHDSSFCNDLQLYTPPHQHSI